MNRRRGGTPIVAALMAASATLGCGAAPQQAQPAGAAFVMHAQGLVGAEPKHGVATTGGAGMGVEFTDCCGVGAFISTTTRSSSDGRKRSESSNIAAGGLELSVLLLPFLPNLRLAGRVGRAGTRPERNGMVSSGYSMGASATWRLSSNGLLVSDTTPLVDIVLSYDAWQLRDYNAAGSGDSPQDGRAILVGLRIGAQHGLDLK